MAQEVFNRYELKFMVDYKKYEELLAAFKEYTACDSYGDSGGNYNITNLYFDTEDSTFFNETENSIDFRQKLRLRVYNDADANSLCYLEVKQKHRGVVNKRRTEMKLGDAYEFLYNCRDREQLSNFQASNKQILAEINFLKNFYKLEPKVVVSYHRQAFQGLEEKDLRITFDSNLIRRNYDLRVEGKLQGDYFIDPDLLVLEVKVNSRVPYWVTRILSDHGCFRQSISKYCISQRAELTKEQTAVV